MPIESINPATEELLARFEEDGEDKIEAALARSATAFLDWRSKSFEHRAALMRAAARQLRTDKARLASLITAEMGKPIRESEAEVEKCAWCCDFYAVNAERFLSDIPTRSSGTDSYVAFDPLGPVLAVMPWNFPFWQVFRFAAPGLMAGNTGVLKHASNVPQCALAIEHVFTDAGFPEGVFQTLLVSGSRAGRLIADERITAVTLTGSDIAGAIVAEQSGRVLKKTVLELGGSDPFIVLRDADLDAAIETAVTARYQNTGQSCIAAKRFIVEDGVYEDFLSGFVEGVQRLRTGDPVSPDTNVGPLARGDLRADLEDQVARSLVAGARIACGGSALDRGGYFYAPTVLTGVEPGMPAFDEETFGPVAAVIRARDADDAVALANRSKFGLGAALWTRDLDAARGLARRIESGSVFINGMVASHPALPFGGVKRSGYGRELGEYGIREFVNIKTVWIGPRRDEDPIPTSE